MALGSVAVAAVLVENQASWAYWLWWLSSCWLWPHAAFYYAQSRPQPYLAERRNLLIDSFIAGTWAALMWFNLLPTVMLLLTSIADKINSGIRNLWLYSLPVLFFGLALGWVLSGFKFQPETSMTVILASLPILIVHISFVSLGSYQLIRKVQKQNKRLKELSQKDSLTHLFNRRHWQQEVGQLFQQTDEQPTLSLIVIDIDHFKQLNDEHGHSVGDDVLLAIADVITQQLPESAIAGRLGGDEFAVVLQDSLESAKQVADKIRQQVANLTVNKTDQLSCTVSIGLSERNSANKDFRTWFDEADKSLYQAKNAGRNQII